MGEVWENPGKSVGNEPGHGGYTYGMRLRPFSIGCQPMDGLIGCRAGNDPVKSGYWDILEYSRKLSDKELDDFDLDYLGEEDQ